MFAIEEDSPNIRYRPTKPTHVHKDDFNLPPWAVACSRRNEKYVKCIAVQRLSGLSTGDRVSFSLRGPYRS